MLKARPRVRFDGIYICKIHYVRFGESECSAYRPVYDVITYKYIKFCENGRAVSIYTNTAPKKFVHKLGGRAADLMQLAAHGNPKKK